VPYDVLIFVVFFHISMDKKLTIFTQITSDHNIGCQESALFLPNVGEIGRKL
jgi:hypothetical protein